MDVEDLTKFIAYRCSNNKYIDVNGDVTANPRPMLVWPLSSDI